MIPTTIVHGIILGLVYGVLAGGLVVVYKASGVVNFAYGETGALGAAILAKLVVDDGWPWLAALPLVLVIGGVIGGATELLLARRLANRPRLALLVATIGLSQLLLVGQLELPAIRHFVPYPSLLHKQISFGSVVITGPDFLALAAVPAIVVAVAIWLRRTPSGRALRASADNPDAARLAGVRPGMVTFAAWTVAGVLSTATAVIANPIQGVIVGQQTEAIGASLLVRALAAALVGRLESLPWALAGGIGVGLVQATADAGHISQSAVDVVLLAAVLVLVLLRPSRERASSARGQLVAVAALRRRYPWAGLAAAAVAVIVLCLVMPLVAGRSSQLFLLSRMALYALVGLSVVILTGWAGQLSLGQFAIVGIGTFGAALLERHGVPFWLTVALAGVAGAAASAVVGLPALRARGLDLAITTLALAVACSTWLFTQSWFAGSGGSAVVERGKLGPLDVRGDVAFYEACVVALGCGLVAVAVIRRADLGRRMLAVRSNERRAAVAGVSPAATKLTAFVVAGVLAGVAGALLAGLRVRSGAADFTPDQSLQVVAVAVIGGAGSAVGAVLGAIVVLGVPAIFGDTTVAGLLPSGIGLLVLVLLFPGGLLELVDRIAARVPFLRGALAAPPPPSVAADPHPTVVTSRAPATLEVRDVTVHFGGRLALDHVTVDAAPGKVLGVVGANGAGKSTLLDVISGLVTPTEGAVTVDGHELGSLTPAARARTGIGRVLQDAALFDDLSVEEAVLLATSGRGEARRARAAETLALFGLAVDATTPCQLLSTGTRRLVEVACAVTSGPSLLLLDEPTAGLSRDESAFVEPLIARLRDELGVTIVIVEHDVRLVLALADQLVCLQAGKVLAAGAPDAVISDPAVVESFLGTPTS